MILVFQRNLWGSMAERLLVSTMKISEYLCEVYPRLGFYSYLYLIIHLHVLDIGDLFVTLSF